MKYLLKNLAAINDTEICESLEQVKQSIWRRRARYRQFRKLLVKLDKAETIEQIQAIEFELAIEVKPLKGA